MAWQDSKAGYYRRVWKLTERTYEAHLKDINPEGYSRGTAWQLDHKFSIAEGFKNMVQPEIIASRHNLEMLDAGLNSTKGADCSLTLEELEDRFLLRSLQ